MIIALCFLHFNESSGRQSYADRFFSFSCIPIRIQRFNGFYIPYSVGWLANRNQMETNYGNGLEGRETQTARTTAIVTGYLSKFKSGWWPHVKILIEGCLSRHDFKRLIAYLANRNLFSWRFNIQNWKLVMCNLVLMKVGMHSLLQRRFNSVCNIVFKTVSIKSTESQQPSNWNQSIFRVKWKNVARFFRLNAWMTYFFLW